MIEVELKDGRKLSFVCSCDGYEWDSTMKTVGHFIGDITLGDSALDCPKCGYYPWYDESFNKKKQVDNEPKMLIQYIVRNRNKQKQKVGCLVGMVVNESVCIGWSLCSPEDTFNKQRAKQMAIGRASTGGWMTYPPSIREEAEEFHRRCFRYFKEPELDFKSYNEVADERD